MNPAWIAVLGTLGGVVVTSITGVSVRSDHPRARDRRAPTSRAADTFVEFLAAYRELREKVLASGQQARANALPLSEVFPTEVSACAAREQAPLRYRRR
jgi:hypothetical protein